MRRKNLWLRLSSCTMAALIATTSIVPVSAADVEFQDEVSVETPDTEAEEVSEAPEAEVQEQEDITLTTEENTDQAAEKLQDAEDAAELTAEDGFSDGDAVVQEAAADAVSDTVQTGFGSANTSLEKGAYAVTVTLMNASDPTKESMAASCIAGKGTLVVAEDGSAKLTVPIQAANVRGQVAYAKDWKVYKNSEKTESTDAEYTVDEDGNVNSITFDIPDKTQDGVYVSMYIELMNAIQDAFMNVDYANAEKEQVGVDTTALEAAIAQADGQDFFIDLVFYNYILKCFVLIDLKMGKLTHQDLGQMQMYVNYYTREMMNEGDTQPIGIVLCADKGDSIVKYTLPEDNHQIFASKYFTYLPSEEELKRELNLKEFRKKE